MKFHTKCQAEEPHNDLWGVFIQINTPNVDVHNVWIIQRTTKFQAQLIARELNKQLKCDGIRDILSSNYIDLQNAVKSMDYYKRKDLKHICRKIDGRSGELKK